MGRNALTVAATSGRGSAAGTASQSLFGLRRAALCACLALGLAGCGITYVSPVIDQEDPDLPVQVVPLDFDQALLANKSPYTPRALPAAFNRAAGGGSGLRGTGALPVPPAIPTERPEEIVLSPPPSITHPPYRIGVGDVVLLATTGSATTIEQLSGILAAQNQRQGYAVRDDGTIAIPEVGPVAIAGQTLQEAEAELFQVLVANQINPSFSLEISEFNSQKVAIGGAVKSAQLVPITPQALSLYDALTLAGGITLRDEEFGVVRVYREGALYEIPVAALRSQPALRDTLLQNGDAVFVDTTYDLERAFEFYRQQIDVVSLRSDARGDALQALQTEIGIQRQALEERRQNFEARVSLDAVDRDYVYLTGEVKSQSRVPLPFERTASLADVLYDKGGLENATGNPSEIYVLRAGTAWAGATDAVVAFHLDAKNAANVLIATRFEMRPNDVVFIEEQPITKWSRSLQQLLPVLVNRATR